MAFTAGTVTVWEKAAAVTFDPYPAVRNSSYVLLSPSGNSHIPLKGGRIATATCDGLRGTINGIFLSRGGGRETERSRHEN